jgi:hypothetical protein
VAPAAGLRPLDLVQDAAAMLEQDPARVGGRHTAPVAQQQVLPQLDFQQAHLAERRLGHAKRRPRG